MNKEIMKLEEEFHNKRNKLTTEYREKIKAIITEILKSTGMYDPHNSIKVRNKRDGSTGYLILCQSNYSDLGFELKFHPIKKDGKLSKRTINIYNVSFRSDNAKKKILEQFELA